MTWKGEPETSQEFRPPGGAINSQSRSEGLQGWQVGRRGRLKEAVKKEAVSHQSGGRPRDLSQRSKGKLSISKIEERGQLLRKDQAETTCAPFTLTCWERQEILATPFTCGLHKPTLRPIFCFLTIWK